jgi:hypothetical protein
MLTCLAAKPRRADHWSPASSSKQQRLSPEPARSSTSAARPDAQVVKIKVINEASFVDYQGFNLA